MQRGTGADTRGNFREEGSVYCDEYDDYNDLNFEIVLLLYF